VADGLSAYLNGVQERLKTAERERAVALAREAEQAKRRKVQLALTAAVVALLLGRGAFVWWRNAQVQAERERDIRNAEAVAALLGQAEVALRADDAAKAQVALEAARKRWAEGRAEKETQRLEQLEADLALLRDLDAVDQFRWTWAENKFPDWSVVATRTREALRRFGADPDAAPEDEAAARISASVVRERIISALDQLLLPIRLVDVATLPAEEQKWYTPQTRAAVAELLPKTGGVHALLRRVDRDSYRDAVRDAIQAEDRAKFAQLAGRPAALEQPPGFVAFLGESRAIPVERRRQLLKAVVSRRPGNLGLLMTLALSYSFNRKESADEMLRWYQAAVAAAPANYAAHINLGNALMHKDQVDEAMACYRKALALDPKDAKAHINLGALLCDGKRDYDGAIACFRKALQLDPKSALAHRNLGIALAAKGQLDKAIACYRKALELDPKDALAHTGLGNALARKGQVDEAIACYRKAIALDPKFAMPHNNLGNALKDKGQLDEAIAYYRKAIELDPKLALAHYGLGNALMVKGPSAVDEAIACYRKAIALDPNLAGAHTGLGNALSSKGKAEEAIACWRKAIELDPKLALAHYNLGRALHDKGQLDDAIACYKRAIALELKDASLHINLGLALQRKGKVDEAVACFRQAIALDPKYAAAHSNLGHALLAKGELDEAIACFRKAIEFTPKLALAHFGLGAGLARKGQVDEAIACYRKAIELDPKLAEPHAMLGLLLLGQGRYVEAQRPMARALELFPDKHPLRALIARYVQQGERLVKLEGLLPRLLAREETPASAAECVDVAILCRHKRMYAAAARFFAAAFAAEPKLADNLEAGHRYDAACYAALAAAGQGEDTGKLDAKERTRLRRQAFDWLKADLALYAKRLQSGSRIDRGFVTQKMQHWQKDTDLAGIRDEAALAKLQHEERAACERLWADVAALLKKAETPPKEGK
jgi:superkiller protein 3